MEFFGKARGFASAASLVRRIAGRVDAKQMALREAERLRGIIIDQRNAQEPATGTFGDWPDHSPLTIPERELSGIGGSLKLNRTGTMFNSVLAKQTSTGAWVGVPRKAGPSRKRAPKGSARKPRKGRRAGGQGMLKDKLDRKLAAAKEPSKRAQGKKPTGKGKSKGKREPLANVAELMEFGSKGSIAVRITPAMRRFLFGVLFRKAATTGKVSGSKPGFVVYTIPPRPFMRPAAEKWEQTAGQSMAEEVDRILEGA